MNYLVILLVVISSINLLSQNWLKVDSVFSVSGVTVKSFSAPEFADLNNDGNYSILLGFENGTIEVYNAATKELVKKVLPTTNTINSIVFADADNDNEKEIVIFIKLWGLC